MRILPFLALFLPGYSLTHPTSSCERILQGKYIAQLHNMEVPAEIQVNFQYSIHYQICQPLSGDPHPLEQMVEDLSHLANGGGNVDAIPVSESNVLISPLLLTKTLQESSVEEESIAAPRILAYLRNSVTEEKIVIADLNKTVKWRALFDSPEEKEPKGAVIRYLGEFNPANKRYWGFRQVIECNRDVEEYRPVRFQLDLSKSHVELHLEGKDGCVKDYWTWGYFYRENRGPLMALLIVLSVFFLACGMVSLPWYSAVAGWGVGFGGAFMLISLLIVGDGMIIDRSRNMDVFLKTLRLGSVFLFSAFFSVMVAYLFLRKFRTSLFFISAFSSLLISHATLILFWSSLEKARWSAPLKDALFALWTLQFLALFMALTKRKMKTMSLISACIIGLYGLHFAILKFSSPSYRANNLLWFYSQIAQSNAIKYSTSITIIYSTTYMASILILYGVHLLAQKRLRFSVAPAKYPFMSDPHVRKSVEETLQQIRNEENAALISNAEFPADTTQEV